MPRATVFSMVLSVIALTAIGPLPCAAQASPREEGGFPFELAEALVCEGVREGIPFNQAIVFSASTGTLCCYTVFDDVRKDTFIYHQWLSRDKPSTRFKLSLKKPRWATFSSIQLREGDTGPWQVEIMDSGGEILKTLRFSVVD